MKAVLLYITQFLTHISKSLEKIWKNYVNYVNFSKLQTLAPVDPEANRVEKKIGCAQYSYPQNVGFTFLFSSVWCRRLVPNRCDSCQVAVEATGTELRFKNHCCFRVECRLPAVFIDFHTNCESTPNVDSPFAPKDWGLLSTAFMYFFCCAKHLKKRKEKSLE